MLSLVGVVTAVTSAITGAVVSVVVDVSTVVVVLSSLLFLAHEMMVKLKRRERIMSICFTWFPISWFEEVGLKSHKFKLFNPFDKHTKTKY